MREQKTKAARGQTPGRSLATGSRPPGQVRIIGGQWKRTPIPVPDQPGLRPSGDRVRETLFNWLRHLAGDFSALRGLDLFAGSGALGFEFASRGAAQVMLIERDAQLARALRALKDKLKAGNIEVVQGEALAIAQRLPGPFEVIFIDPPFAAGLQDAALAAAARLLAPGGWVYLESPAPLAPEAAAAAGWAIDRAEEAGRVAFHLLRRV